MIRTVARIIVIIAIVLSAPGFLFVLGFGLRSIQEDFGWIPFFVFSGLCFIAALGFAALLDKRNPPPHL